MNLIYCANNCKHQKDGYCTITELKAPGNQPQNSTGCIYYVPPKEGEASPKPV